MSEHGKKRIEAIYTGRVQGVGFRASAQAVAQGFDVGGFVRNQPDGSVQVIAEGPAGEVEGFLNAVRDKMGWALHGVQTRETSDGGAFHGFNIRH